MTNVTVMRLSSTDLTAIEAQLREQITQAPAFLRGALLTVDLEGVEENSLDLSALVHLLRDAGLVPIAVRGGGAQVNESAAGLNLGSLQWTDTRSSPPPERPDPPTRTPESAAAAVPATGPVAATPPAAGGAKSPTLVISQLVRSGQQIYARGGDLMILNQVSPGAEVIADGHIHVYGTLRGRALAGAQGDENARVLCRQLEAELIAVAGVYRVSEQLDERLRGKSVQAYLQEGNLVLEEM